MDEKDQVETRVKPKIQTIIDGLEELSEESNGLANRLQIVADRVFGTEPSAEEENKPNLGESRMDVMATLILDIKESLKRADRHCGRLNNDL